MSDNDSVNTAWTPRLLGTGLPDASSAQKAIDFTVPLRHHFASDERIAVRDDHPFGIDVAIRSTLALAALQTILEQSAATRH